MEVLPATREEQGFSQWVVGGDLVVGIELNRRRDRLSVICSGGGEEGSRVDSPPASSTAQGKEMDRFTVRRKKKKVRGDIGNSCGWHGGAGCWLCNGESNGVCTDGNGEERRMKTWGEWFPMLLMR